MSILIRARRDSLPMALRGGMDSPDGALRVDSSAECVPLPIGPYASCQRGDED